MHLLQIYSGGQEDYNYRRQFLDTFPEVKFGDRLTLEHIPEADHIFTGLSHQQQVVDTVSRWMRSMVGSDAPAGVDASESTRTALAGV